MAEENTVTMTVENIDRLFPEIVVNGESHVSENYVPPVQLEQSVPQTVEDEEAPQNNTPAQATQGQDVHAVELNDVLHDFVDPEVAQGLADEIQTRRNADTALQNSINTINSKIPNQASSENQLADKNFVNSSIATNTANFLGTYTTLQEIEAIPNPTNNDYAYWDTTDSAGNTVYKRYKYNGEDDEWLYEYDLNNSSFTAEQWATINSGLTQASVDEDIQEAISQVGSGIEVYDTEEEMEEDLPNKQDGDLVGTLSSDEGELQDAPLGSVTSYLGSTDPSDGKWLICDGRDTTGTAIELETHYPSLYMFLGGTNVLPYIVDRNSPLDYTRIVTRNLGGNSTDTWTATDAGLVVAPFVGFNGAYGYVSVNGVTITRASTPNNQVGAQCGACSVFVEKGDVIKVCNNYHTVANTWSFIPFSKYKIIKAVSSVDMYHAPASEIAQIEQYFDEGQQRAQSYSTTETWTGGYWIDGKPIYRKCFYYPNGVNAYNQWYVIKDKEDENLIIRGIWSTVTPYSGNGYTVSGVCTVGITSANKIAVHISTYSEAQGTKAIILEYTKATD